MINILIAVHNGEKQLKSTFESIYKQTYPDWEIIAVDDGSTDDTFNLLEEERRRYPNKIRVLKNKENIGLTKSLISAAEEAGGEFLARLDIGDVFLPEKLKKQAQFLENNPDYGLVGCGYINLWKNSDRKQLIQPAITDEEIKKTILKNNPFAHSAILIRTEIYKQAGGYNPEVKYGQDYDLWLRMIQFGKAFNLQESLCIRIIDNNSISYRKQKEQMKQCLKTRWKYMNKFNIKHYFYLCEPFLMMIISQKIKVFLRRYLS